MKSFSFGWYEIRKVLKGAAIAAAGGVLSYATIQITDLETTDYAWLIPLFSILVNIGKEWVANNS